MTSPPVSFRISRSAEDLAETIHALSKRLVALEQRLGSFEALLSAEREEDPQDVERLHNVERLLQDCRQLLGADGQTFAEPALPAPLPVPSPFADEEVRDAA